MARKCSRCHEEGHRVTNCPKRLAAVAKSRHAGQATSARKAVTSAANGQLGGRPPDGRMAALFVDLAPPPDDTLGRVKWAQGFLCTATMAFLQGRLPMNAIDIVRRQAEGISKLAPRERLYDAEALIKTDMDALRNKPRATGPQPQKPRPGKPSR